jgi:methionine synthase II (cobalamin-independent)
MAIPTEPVGSLPRPAKLQAAYADYDAAKQRRTDMVMLDRRKLRRSGTAAVAVAVGAGALAPTTHQVHRWTTSWKG